MDPKGRIGHSIYDAVTPSVFYLSEREAETE
jgi:hypothetical protein